VPCLIPDSVPRRTCQEQDPGEPSRRARDGPAVSGAGCCTVRGRVLRMGAAPPGLPSRAGGVPLCPGRDTAVRDRGRRSVLRPRGRLFRTPLRRGALEPCLADLVQDSCPVERARGLTPSLGLPAGLARQPGRRACGRAGGGSRPLNAQHTQYPVRILCRGHAVPVQPLCDVRRDAGRRSGAEPAAAASGHGGSPASPLPRLCGAGGAVRWRPHGIAHRGRRRLGAAGPSLDARGLAVPGAGHPAGGALGLRCARLGRLLGLGSR